MRLYSFSYIIESEFSPAVTHHFFKLRALPMECDFQHVLKAEMSVAPVCSLLKATDGFGNDIQYGGYSVPHERFCVECHGEVECSGYEINGTGEDIYRFPTRLTEWNEDIKSLALSADAEDIMHRVHQHIKYERFQTFNTTTAIEVYNQRKGVCQDYAHLMIAACRSHGLYARYVNGLMLGEGETHAWVEVHDGTKWRGYDPTLDRVIDYGYIKFAHGRDVADCPSNRGRFYGWTMENMKVNCKVQIKE